MIVVPKELFVGVPRIIVSSNAPITVTGTTSLTTIISETIPGGILGNNGYLQWEGLLSSPTPDARTGFIKINGLTLSQPGNSGQAAIRFFNILKNQGAQNVNAHGGSGSVSGLNYGSSTGAVTARTINTAADMALQVQLQPATTGAIVVLEYFILWAVYKP